MRIALVENQSSLPLLGALAGAVLAFVFSDFDRKPDPDEWGIKVDRVVRNVAWFTRRASASAERTQRRYDPLPSAELVPPPSSEPVFSTEAGHVVTTDVEALADVATGAEDIIGSDRIFDVEPVLGGALAKAIDGADAWIATARISRTDRLPRWSVRAERP